MFPTNSECLIGISDAFSAFCLRLAQFVNSKEDNQDIIKENPRFEVFILLDDTCFWDGYNSSFN